MVYKRTIFNHIKLSIPCLLCQQQQTRDGICAGCRAQLPGIEHACLQCGQILEGELERVCGQCLRHPPCVDRTTSLFHYAAPIAEMVCRLKFQQELAYGRILGELMAEQLAARHIAIPQVLIPVPLHRKRMRSRGFNQAMELARPISRQLQIPIDTQLCLRSRHTHEQSQLSIKDRKRNVRSAFTLHPKARSYQHVVLLDDVVTTGQTVNELARILKQAGVKRVDVWSCCRA